LYKVAELRFELDCSCLPITQELGFDGKSGVPGSGALGGDDFGEIVGPWRRRGPCPGSCGWRAVAAGRRTAVQQQRQPHLGRWPRCRRGWGGADIAAWTGEEPARTDGAVERRGAGVRGAARQGESVKNQGQA
jgi:hypothetical protein